jgi:Ca2+/Na+ antiporter
MVSDPRRVKKLRHYRRATMISAAVLFWFGLAYLVSPIGNSVWGVIFLILALASVYVVWVSRP